MTFKNYLIDRFFKKEKEAIKYEREMAKSARREADSYLEAVAGKSIVQVAREHLKGFDPRLLDSESDILDQYEDDDAEMTFLSKVKDIKGNPAFQPICDFLIRNQILFSAKEADTMEAVNFGRASVNGISLFREEVDRLVGEYEKRNAEGDKFDEHEIV